MAALADSFVRVENAHRSKKSYVSNRKYVAERQHSIHQSAATARELRLAVRAVNSSAIAKTGVLQAKCFSMGIYHAYQCTANTKNDCRCRRNVWIPNHHPAIILCHSHHPHPDAEEQEDADEDDEKSEPAEEKDEEQDEEQDEEKDEEQEEPEQEEQEEQEEPEQEEQEDEDDEDYIPEEDEQEEQEEGSPDDSSGEEDEQEQVPKRQDRKRKCTQAKESSTEEFSMEELLEKVSKIEMIDISKIDSSEMLAKISNARKILSSKTEQKMLDRLEVAFTPKKKKHQVYFDFQRRNIRNAAARERRKLKASQKLKIQHESKKGSKRKLTDQEINIIERELDGPSPFPLRRAELMPRTVITLD